MSQNNDLRAKTRSWCRPTWDHTRANFGMKPFKLSTVKIICVADHRSAMAEADDEKFLSDRGFQRVSEDVPKVFYITPFPRQQNLYKRDQVDRYLEKQNKAGKHTDVTASMFRFSKKRSKPEVLPVGGAGDVIQPDLESVLQSVLQPDLQPAQPVPGPDLAPPPSLLEATVSRLAKEPGPMVNHRKDLCGAARDLEQSF